MNEHIYGEETMLTPSGVFRVRVVHAPDEIPSPRENYQTHLARLVLPYPKLGLPREGEIADRIIEAFQRLDSFEDVARWLRIFHGASVVLPVWAYGQSVFRFRLHATQHRPQAGWLAGLVYDDPRVRADTGRTDSTEITAELADAVATYDRWTHGDLYAYRLEQLTDTGPQDPLDADARWRWVGYHDGYYSVADAMAHGIDAIPTRPAPVMPDAEPAPHPNVTTLAVHTEHTAGNHAATPSATTITDIGHTLTATGSHGTWRGSCSCGDWTTADSMKLKSSVRRAHRRHIDAADTYVASVHVSISPLDGAVVVKLHTSLTRDVPARIVVNDHNVFDEQVEP